MSRLLSKTSFLILFLLAGGVSLTASDDLEIQVNRQTRRVNSKENQGKPYYRLTDIAQALGLRLQQRGARLAASGQRGAIELTAGRPLARFGDQYIMLDAPVWERSSGDWFVPEDFMTKAAPLLIDSRLERVGRKRYRLDTLDENAVSVEVINYPDHVSIVFLPSRPCGIRVTEFQRHIKVEFDSYLVRPRLASTPPDPRLVTSIQYDSGSAYGGFEIGKGPLYGSYREYTLGDPERKVLGVYGSATPVENESPAATAGPLADATNQPLVVPDETAPEFTPQQWENIITIDPGHGGENYGVHPNPEALEKNFTLRLALKLEEKLKKTRYRPALTRSRDLNLSHELRSAFGNRNRSKAYVSLHFGGSSSTEMSGPVVYVHHYMADPEDSYGRLVPWTEGQRKYLARSRDLAEDLQARLNTLFGKENHVVEVPLAVLEPVTAPAVLIEAGFLSNSDDRARLSDPAFQEMLAESIVGGLMDFLK